jgi:phospholipase C
MSLRAPAAIALALAVTSGCSPSTGGPAVANPPMIGRRAIVRDLSPDSLRKIKHVVVIVQENRSFDNLFQGYPGADTVSSGKLSNGQTVALQPVSLAAPYDIEHVLSDFLAGYDNGNMDGFDKELAYGNLQGYPHPEYGYVPHSESTRYFAMAGQYVLADRMFASNVDASFVSHQYIIAAQANNAVDLPTGQWGCGGGSYDHVFTITPQRTLGPTEPPCFTYKTIADELDARKLTWRFYTPQLGFPGSEWSAFAAVSQIRNGPDWTNDVVSPEIKVLQDVANATLANVTWVVPSESNSDHPGIQTTTGPKWVASVVNAIGQSKFWSTTAIFVMWDEWGGWYDHVTPPYVDSDGLGIRVPLLVISPYAKKGYVSHVTYEHGSILRFMEDRFGLARLAASDRRATSPEADCFDFTQAPRPFTPF